MDQRQNTTRPELLVLPEDLVVPVEVEWIGVDADGDADGFVYKPSLGIQSRYLPVEDEIPVSLFWYGAGDGSLKLYKRTEAGFERAE